jgi:excisionase family DNA binding protein
VPSEELLRVWPDLGGILRVSRSTAYSLIASGQIPAVKIGSKITRVRREDVDRFLADHLTEAAAAQ